MDQPREAKTQRFSFVIKDKAPIDWTMLSDLPELDRQRIDDALNDVNSSYVSAFGEDVAMIDAEYSDGAWTVRGAVQCSFQCQSCYAMTVPSVIARVRAGDDDAEVCKSCGARLDVLHEVVLDDTNATVHTVIGRADRELRDVYYRESKQRLSLDVVAERAERELNEILQADPSAAITYPPYSPSSRLSTENCVGLRLNEREVELVLTATNVCSRGSTHSTASRVLSDSWLDALSSNLSKSQWFSDLSEKERAKLPVFLRLVREWREAENV
jgi:hypothetical protein